MKVLFVENKHFNFEVVWFNGAKAIMETAPCETDPYVIKRGVEGVK